jgi:IclR family transcriptional regulator, KDG regulon repressor
MTANQEKQGRPRRGRVPTAVTGLQILELLARYPGGLGVTEIAQTLDLDVGQTHRLVRHLVEDRWLSQRSGGANYEVTGKLLASASRFLRSLDLAQIATPVVAALKQQSGETVHVVALRADLLICVARALSDNPVAVTADVGDSWPLTGTAVGAAVSLGRSLQSGAEFLRPEQAARAHPAIAESIRRGYGEDLGQFKSGVSAVAAPIWDGTPNVVGAIAISGPDGRMGDATRETLGALVQDAALGMSESLGCDVADLRAWRKATSSPFRATPPTVDTGTAP